MKKNVKSLLCGVFALLIIASCSKDDEPDAKRANAKLSNTSYNYGDVIVNRNSKEQTFVVTNSGNINLEIKSITVAGTNASEFTTNGTTKTIEPSKKYSFKATFTPISLGNKTAELLIKTSVGDKKIELSSKGAAPVPEEGLVSFWDFSGNAKDLKGTANGRNTSAGLIKDRFNKSASAYQINDRAVVNVGDQTYFNGKNKKFSISSWVKPSHSKSFSTIIGKFSAKHCNGSSAGKEFIVSINSKKQIHVLFYQEGTGFRWITSTGTIEKDKWASIVVTYDSTVTIDQTTNGINRIEIFINGVKQEKTLTDSSKGVPEEIEDTKSHIGIGNLLDFSGNICQNHPLMGGIDDVAIYNKVLTQAEVTKIAADK